MITKLSIESRNPDLNGTWKKSDVEDEMKELGFSIATDNDWMSWICSHMFSFEDSLPDGVEKVICEMDCIVMMTVKINGMPVIVRKS